MKQLPGKQFSYLITFRVARPPSPGLRGTGVACLLPATAFRRAAPRSTMTSSWPRSLMISKKAGGPLKMMPRARSALSRPGPRPRLLSASPHLSSAKCFPPHRKPYLQPFMPTGGAYPSRTLVHRVRHHRLRTFPTFSQQSFSRP